VLKPFAEFLNNALPPRNEVKGAEAKVLQASMFRRHEGQLQKFGIIEEGHENWQLRATIVYPKRSIGIRGLRDVGSRLTVGSSGGVEAIGVPSALKIGCAFTQSSVTASRVQTPTPIVWHARARPNCLV
jgi:hypothetical protein